jgi:acyl-CoA synthetase (AMP-forming)/AMP-acid ligase II
MTRAETDLPWPGMLVETSGRSSQGPSAVQGFTFLGDGDEATARLSHEQLQRRAQVIGAGIGMATKAGDRVVLISPPGLEFIEALFGCFHGGTAAVPVPWQRPGRSNSQLEAIVENSGATLALTTRSFLKLRDRFVEGEFRLGTLRWLAVEDFEEDPGDSPARPTPEDRVLSASV